MSEISHVSPWHPFAHTTPQTHLTTSGAERHTVILALGRKWQKNQEFKEGHPQLQSEFEAP